MHTILKHIFFTLFLTLFLNTNAQKLPDFTTPVDIPIYLSGTFGELRSNHFHSGIDIRTQGVEGKNIIAFEDGWVSRIKISTGGYGKALYVTHPNGYVSVYGHLQKYNDVIQKYVIGKQYEQESFTIEIFPDKGEIPVRKGQIIAFSGNTGSSMGPHLHFEIRKEKSQHPVNPLQFEAIKIKDYYRPRIQTLAVYPVNEKSVVSGKNDTALYNVEGWGLNHRINDTIRVKGDIAFGISTYDLMNDIPNKNGVYSIKAWFDTTLFFNIEMDELSFNTTRYINSLIDYGYAQKTKEIIVRTQLDTNNILKNYKTIVHNGIINICDTMQHTLAFEVTDYYDNVSKLKCLVISDTTIIPDNENAVINLENYVVCTEPFQINDDIIDIKFPANTFYRSFHFDYKKISQADSLSDIFAIHNRFTPAHKSFTIKLQLPDLDSISKNQTYIAYSTDNKEYSFSGNTIKNNIISVKSRDLGYYKLMQDSIPPEIIFKNFSDSSNISGRKSIEVIIKDNQTGIADYHPTLNGKWILMEYDVKKNRLIYNFDDKLKKGANEFEIIVIDLLGNKAIREAVLVN